MNEKEKKNYELARELRDLVSEWVDKTFNQINVSVFSKLTDGCLFEHIRPLPIDSDVINDFLEYSEDGETVKTIREELKEEELKEGTEEAMDYILLNYKSDIQIYMNENNLRENYPMWNTCFEVRSTYNTDIVDLGQEVGLGVIEGLDDFDLNPALFAMSCGHSFYSAYWIPLYLKVNADAEHIKKFKDVEFGMV
ncbi:MAG: hypothetical protein DRO67_00620 [Candidatus Asgardarchaeum californiense]|nr:MAG: hypothetical protein DRO67_00620 [Candidatus Asgardarchaeum californiense]